MEKGKKPVVIAIAAVSGGGKTTITSHLSKKLLRSKALYFDDYDFDGPEDILEWVENGSDYNEWDLTPLVRDLKALLNEPLNTILMDYPFAYVQSQVSEFIDLAFFIDTPLDIALARRHIRDFENSNMEDATLDMKNYLLRGRKAYLEMLDTVRPNSDMIIDGTLTISDIANEIVKKIE